MWIVIIKTIFSVLQAILCVSVAFTCKNKNDKAVSMFAIGYLALITVALWL